MEEGGQKGSMVKKLLDDKDKEIQALKKRLRIPGSQLAQAQELAEFEKEKEALNSKLAHSQAKLLKLEKKGKQWEADIQLLRNSEIELKVILVVKESEIHSRNAKKEIQPTGATE